MIRFECINYKKGVKAPDKYKTTVGHTGSNACGEDKVHVFPIKEKQVIFKEAGKRITPVVS